jgi:hypothetical protein
MSEDRSSNKTGKYVTFNDEQDHKRKEKKKKKMRYFFLEVIFFYLNFVNHKNRLICFYV